LLNPKPNKTMENQVDISNVLRANTSDIVNLKWLAHKKDVEKQVKELEEKLISVNVNIVQEISKILTAYFNKNLKAKFENAGKKLESFSNTCLLKYSFKGADYIFTYHKERLGSSHRCN
jgi:hypothetical protein